MVIEHSSEGFCGRFAAIENGTQVGLLTYTQMDDNRISINYTEVNPALEGKGIGQQLVDAAVNFARKQHVKILPLCWFVKLVLNKHPEYQDVLG